MAWPRRPINTPLRIELSMKALRIAGAALLVIFALLVVLAGILYALFDGDRVKAELSRVVLASTQRTLVISGTPRLSVWPNVGVQLERVTLSERASDAPFLVLDAARVSVAVVPLLSRKVQVRALDLTGLRATVIKKKDGSLNVADLLGEPAATDAPGQATSPQAPPEPVNLDIAAIRIHDAQLTWRDEKKGTETTLSQLNLETGPVLADSGQQTASLKAVHMDAKGRSGTDAFTVTLDAPAVLLSPIKSSADLIKLAATLTGADRTASAQLTLTGLSGNAQAAQVGSLALTFDAKAGQAKASGQLRSPVAVNMAAHTVALGQLEGKLDVAHPSMPMKNLTLPLAGALRANWAQPSVALNVRTQFDQSKVVSAVSVSRFSPLALVFDLDVDQLNVDTYFPPKPAQAEGAKGAKGGATGPEAVLDFSALKGPQVRGALHIGALQVSGLKLAQLNAKVHLADGRLDVAPLAMNLYGGATSGSAMVNATGNAVALRQNMVGISINPLMQDLLHKDMIEGRGNVSLDLSSRGATVGAMKRALQGKAALSLKDGAIKGINLAQTLRDIKSKLGQPDATQQAKAGEKTDFSELTASLTIRDGVARNDDLAMKSPFLRLSGAGDINIGLGQMNYLAKATVVGSAQGQGGQSADQLTGLTLPVRVSGPFEALSYRLEFASMVADAAKGRVQEKTQELKGQLEEKAKDLLKGLFGR
jgi:AsmA protein